MKIKIDYLTLSEFVNVVVCGKCGASIVFKDIHTEFHEEINKLESKLKDFMDTYQRK